MEEYAMDNSCCFTGHRPDKLKGEEKASRKAFPARDRWMVDHAARVIAVFNGTPGGTGYTVDYAKSLGRKITMLDDSTMKETT